MFNHELLPALNLERIDTPNGRYYLCEGNRYKSVTTALGIYYNANGWLEKWKDSIGEENANRISIQARNRGTAMHNLYEQFLLNKELDTQKIMPINLSDFNKVKPILKAGITKVRAVEARLYSHRLKLAGTSDLICDWQNDLAVIDFKTSRKSKNINDIESYLTQKAIYSIMILERYNLKVKKIITVMTIDHESPKIFIRNPKDYYGLAEKVAETAYATEYKR